MDLDRKKFQSVLGIVLIGIAFYWSLNNLALFMTGLDRITNILMPFILGASIAFIVNIPVSMLERTFLKKKWVPEKYVRLIAFLVSVIIFFVAMILLFLFVIPELARSFEVLFDQIPEAFDSIQAFFANLMEKYPNYQGMIESLDIDYANISSGFMGFLQNVAKTFMTSAVDIVNAIVNGTMSLFVGVTFSVYVIFQKEALAVQSKKLLYAFMPEKKADYCVRVATLSATTFTNFISGQGLESLILGLIFFVAMMLFRMPYAMLISVIIAITSIVPIFGAMFGSFVGVFLILLVDPWMAVWFFIMFQIIQQIEGNFIYPHVVGKSVGLPSIWMLFSLTVGGKLMGLVGMIVSIPVFSIMYILLRDVVQKQLKKRNIKKEKLELVSKE